MKTFLVFQQKHEDRWLIHNETSQNAETWEIVESCFDIFMKATVTMETLAYFNNVAQSYLVLSFYFIGKSCFINLFLKC